MKENPHVRLPIQGDERLSAVERLDIYANMYFYRILGSLQEDFPRVLKRIGKDRFHNLVTDYLLKYFPSHWSLRYAGKDLPQFLRNYRPLKRWPSLSELARFEYALLEAFDAADATVLNRNELSSIHPDRWGDLRLRPVPSFQLLRRKKSAMIVWRKNLRVFYRLVNPMEGRLFQRLMKGDRFDRLCEIVMRQRGAGRARFEMVRYLRNWIREGLLQCNGSS